VCQGGRTTPFSPPRLSLRRLVLTSDGRLQRVPDSFTIEETSHGRTLVVTGPWSDEAQALLAGGGVDELVLNYARGFAEQSLAFLASWPIRGLRLLDRSISDLTPIAKLGATLERLSIQAAPRASADLATLPNLTSLAARWDAVGATFHEPNALREAILLDYDEATLAPLAVQPSLRRVVLKVAPILETLDGADAFDALAVLRIAAARELQDLSAIDAARQSLVEVGFEECLELSAIDDLARLTELRFLGVSQCGRIASLAPIAAMGQLETLYAWGSTRVEDADLSPLLSLPSLREVRMRDRKEYQPRLSFVLENLRGASSSHVLGDTGSSSQ